MKKGNLFHIAVSVCALVLAGCETTQQAGQAKPKSNQQAKDKRPIEERLRKGMSKEEVRAAIGSDPAGKIVNSDGLESWTYNDSAKMWIPFYAISGGKFQNLTINFDADGKVKNWSSGKHSIY